MLTEQQYRDRRFREVEAQGRFLWVLSEKQRTLCPGSFSTNTQMQQGSSPRSLFLGPRNKACFRGQLYRLLAINFLSVEGRIFSARDNTVHGQAA